MRLLFGQLGEQDILPGDEVELGGWSSSAKGRHLYVYDVREQVKGRGNWCLELLYDTRHGKQLFHPCYVSKIYPKSRKELI